LYIREALIHSMLISEVSTMKNFIFWAIMTSFLKIIHKVCF
jgi:hypothetical protein